MFREFACGSCVEREGLTSTIIPTLNLSGTLSRRREERRRLNSDMVVSARNVQRSLWIKIMKEFTSMIIGTARYEDDHTTCLNRREGTRRERERNGLTPTFWVEKLTH